MTDETQTSNIKKDEKKPGASSANGNRAKKPSTSSKPTNPGAATTAASSGGGPRPSSRGSNPNRKPPSDNETGKKKEDVKRGGNDNKRNEPRTGGGNRGQGQSNRGGHRKGQASQPGGRQGSGNGGRDTKSSGSAPVAVPGSDSSDALSSLQRVITDLKSISPPTQNSAVSSAASSNLPVNAPVFQPGATGFPSAGAAAAASARHRKAASLGSYNNTMPPNPYGMPQFSSRLGAMSEDNEDLRTPQQKSFEEGEIPEEIYGQQPFPRTQQQQFTAPRFAALAGQQQSQEQGEPLGPSGRPMLAPTFTFGARRRNASNVSNVGLGPPIEEDDAGFQFPQQNQQPDFEPAQPEASRPDSDLVRQQVCPHVFCLVIR